MNTSTNTNQVHGFLRRTTTVALLASAITATTLGLAATAHADFVPGPTQAGAICKAERWGFLGSEQRTLCDGPISADGSWTRERTIWRPASYSPYNAAATAAR